MPKRSRAEELDRTIQAMLAGAAMPSRDADLDAGLRGLLGIAAELRHLPRESFKARLKTDLERTKTMATQAEPATILQTAMPRLRLKNAGAAIEFYKQAFGAQEVTRFEAQGRIAHAVLSIGNSSIAVGEEAPEYGFFGPEALGGSPVRIHLYVDDADALAARAVAAGGRLVMPVKDQFYGDRSGSVADPFGYVWDIATRKENPSVEEMHRRLDAMMKTQRPAAASYIPEGKQALTPYLVVPRAEPVIEFVKDVFGAEEIFRGVGSAGGLHCEVRIGDSPLMIGGGREGIAWDREPSLLAMHIYVEDTDAVYRRALEAGAASIHEPMDQAYGERSAAVKDQAGNYWYIATSQGARFVPEGLRTLTPYLHPLRAEPLIKFLKQAFDAQELEKYATPDGVIQHAKIKIGDSMIEMGEAQGPYQPMQAMFTLLVPDVEAAYSRALHAGASSISGPADQPYGVRSAAVKDTFGNQWYLSMPLA